AAVRSHRHADAVFELRIQIPLEEIGRLHDVHVGVDESETVFHEVLLASRPAGVAPRLYLRGRQSQARVWCTIPPRSEEHTSELQSRGHLVCRLLLEKKKRLPLKVIITQCHD